MRPPYLAGLVGLLAFFLASSVRHYPWPLAFVTGLTFGGFAFALLATVERLRLQLRPRPLGWHVDWGATEGSPAGSAAGSAAAGPDVAPGEDEEGEPEEGMDQPAAGKSREQ